MLSSQTANALPAGGSGTQAVTPVLNRKWTCSAKRPVGLCVFVCSLSGRRVCQPALSHFLLLFYFPFLLNLDSPNTNVQTLGLNILWPPLESFIIFYLFQPVGGSEVRELEDLFTELLLRLRSTKASRPSR